MPKEVRWVTDSWLNNHLEDDISIIDCQPNVHDYIRSHIPGAVYLGEESLRLSRDGVPHRWLDDRLASEVLTRIGVRNERPAVVYGSTRVGLPTGDGVPQGMIAYSLARYGHRDIAILNGGFDRWVKKGRAVSTEYRSGQKGGFKAKTRTDLMVEYGEFIRTKDNHGLVHIDSRPKEQYIGPSPWPKTGHIPGAINVPWSTAFTTENLCELKPMNDIRKVFEAAGVRKDLEVICHCGSGRKAAAQLCVLRWLLGYPKVRLFEGSFTDWCSHQKNVTIVGEQPY